MGHMVGTKIPPIYLGVLLAGKNQEERVLVRFNDGTSTTGSVVYISKSYGESVVTNYDYIRGRHYIDCIGTA